MKKEIAEYVSRCYTCQLVNIEHKRPTGELKPLLILEWKWEHATINFVTALLKTNLIQYGLWWINSQKLLISYPLRQGVL